MSNQYRKDVRRVESIGMSVSADGVAFTVCGGQLVSGETASPEIAGMNGWTVDDVAREIRKAKP
jgi:hypothetical protein